MKTIRQLAFAGITLYLLLFSINLSAQTTNLPKPDVQDVIKVLQASANDWNSGNLDKVMSMYDSSATMMMKTGPVGIDAIKGLYQKYYFVDGKPKQNIKFDDFNIRPLGANYALLTGRFTLSGNNLPDHTGRYSLVFVYTNNGWKVLHDHSG